MEQKLVDSLLRFGLSESEAQVYLATLRVGGEHVSAISKEARVERSNCYHILDTLCEKGLMSVSNRGGRKYFLPESPEQFVQEQKDRLQLAENILPSLLALENTSSGLAPSMKYFEGRAAVEGLLRRAARSKTEVLSYTNIHRLQAKFPKVLKRVSREKSRQGIRQRIISPSHTDADSFLDTYYPQDYIRTSIQLLFVNPKEFFLENDITIYDNSVSIVSLSPDETIGVLIESKVYADSSRTIFSLSWLGATAFVAR